jgi:hypothetical protein
VVDPLLITLGVAYDYVEYPLNFRNVPIARGRKDRDQVSPKAGITWSPFEQTTVRGAYTRSLGGVTFDQSFRLEPSQIAGFNQAYRSLIPESVAGSIAASRFETFGLALDQKFSSGTYLGVAAELLTSDAARQIGTMDLFGFPPSFTNSTTRQRLDYEERTLIASVNQLVGEHWAFGARYQVSDAELESDLTQIPASVSRAARSSTEATLHQLTLSALFRHQSGFFAQADSTWSAQSNRGYSPDIPGDDFWQFNAVAGWSFFHRRLEVGFAAALLGGGALALSRGFALAFRGRVAFRLLPRLALALLARHLLLLALGSRGAIALFLRRLLAGARRVGDSLLLALLGELLLLGRVAALLLRALLPLPLLARGRVACLLIALERRRIDDDALNRRRGHRGARSPRQLDADGEPRDDCDVQHQGPDHGSVVLLHGSHRHASACSRPPLGSRGIGLEADLRGAGLLKQRGARDDAPVRHVLVGLHEHGRLCVAADRRRGQLDDGVVVDRRLLVVGDVQVELAVAIDAQDDRFVVPEQLGVELLRRRIRQINADALREQRRRDHEDDEQHEHHVDIRHDVDLGHEP